MKKIFFLIAILSTISACLNTDSKYKNLIVGKYYSIMREDNMENSELPFSTTVELYEEFLKNGQSIGYGTLKLSILNPNNGNNIIINYEIKANKAKWNIKNEKLYYSYDIQNLDLKIQFKSSNAKNYIDKKIVNIVKKNIENNMIDAIKQWLLEKGEKPIDIVELNEKYLITKNIDGEQITQKRIEEKI